MKTTFRFEKLEVWKRAATLTIPLLSFADQLEARKMWKFTEQLRAATLSITNNIAEGSGSSSNKDFANFLNIARRSAFEVVNMLLIFEQQGLCTREEIEPWLSELEAISRMLEAFRKKLGSSLRQILSALCPPLFAIL
ncbi:MAG: four helix bundle protein [Verrucomicrobiaceae bacterium]|nr:four helix bundle protein [Verrucomicrobiaceae bacterium]